MLQLLIPFRLHGDRNCRGNHVSTDQGQLKYFLPVYRSHYQLSPMKFTYFPIFESSIRYIFFQTVLILPFTDLRSVWILSSSRLHSCLFLSSNNPFNFSLVHNLLLGKSRFSRPFDSSTDYTDFWPN